MAAIHWINNDAGYELWLSENPDGFMANLHKKPDSRYFLIHRATHKLSDRSTPGSVNPRTGKGYSKVTADQVSDLLAWAQMNIPGIIFGEKTFCRTCTPDSDSIVVAAPTNDLAEYVLLADQILARGRVTRPAGVLIPKVVYSPVAQYYRDPNVRAWVLQRAKGHCELCKVEAPFVTSNDEPFLESHHLVGLANAGPDIAENTVALCPNCHRKMHHSKDRIDLFEYLQKAVLTKEAKFSKMQTVVSSSRSMGRAIE